MKTRDHVYLNFCCLYDKSCMIKMIILPYSCAKQHKMMFHQYVK